MAIPEHDLPEFVRGDSYAIPVMFKRNDAEEDLTGWVLWFTAKHHPQQPDEDAVVQKHLTINGSSAVVALVSEDTVGLPVGKYFYDLQLVSPSGDVVNTLVTGRMTLLSGVTNRTRAEVPTP